jgi:hypothetical protein
MSNTAYTKVKSTAYNTVRTVKKSNGKLIGRDAN